MYIELPAMAIPHRFQFYSWVYWYSMGDLLFGQKHQQLSCKEYRFHKLLLCRRHYRLFNWIFRWTSVLRCWSIHPSQGIPELIFVSLVSNLVELLGYVADIHVVVNKSNNERNWNKNWRAILSNIEGLADSMLRCLYWPTRQFLNIMPLIRYHVYILHSC